jgi:hypothetical protein
MVDPVVVPALAKQLFGFIVGKGFGGGREGPSAQQVLEGSPAWNDAELLSRERNRVEGLQRKGQEGTKRDLLRKIDRRLIELEDQGEVPEDDYAGPLPISGDQQLSPVFGFPATAGAVFGMTEEARKAAERQIAKLKDQLKNSVEAKAGRAVRAKKASTGAAIGAAKDLAKKAGKVVRGAKKGPPIRIGPTGVVGVPVPGGTYKPPAMIDSISMPKSHNNESISLRREYALASSGSN